MTNCADTAQVVQQTAHPAIRMQFDTGALTINGEDPTTVLQTGAALIGHVHASEPKLLPLGDCGGSGTDHARMGKALTIHLQQHLVTIEMLATQDEPHLVGIERALQIAIRHYRQDSQNGSTFRLSVL